MKWWERLTSRRRNHQYRKREPGRDYSGQASRIGRQDSADLTDPGPRGGPLGAGNEMPEGGDSTRSPEHLKGTREAA